MNGGEPGPHKTEGIGMEFVPEFLDTSYFDAIHTISDKDAFDRVQSSLGKKASSSVVHPERVSRRDAGGENCETGTNIVTIFPDGSERYLSKKIYQGGV